MRISDWSSDVCSSDLLRRAAEYLVHEAVLRAPQAHRVEAGGGQEIGGIVAAAVRRGKDQRTGLPLRLDDLVRLWGLGARRRSEARRGGKECASTCRSRWCAVP